MIAILILLAFFATIGLIYVFAKTDKDIFIIIGVLLLLTALMDIVGFIIAVFLLICYYKND